MEIRLASNLPKYDGAVLITGGSKGIGSGCARVFCAAGAQVAICARGRAEGASLARELTEKGPGTCFFEPCDVREPAQIERVIAATVERYGRLDCLINNAGMHPPHKPIDDFTVEDFNELLRLNLVSYFVAARCALPHLRKTRGCIINMGSLVGVMGQQLATIYCATKGAINAFSKALAIEEARYGVRVNTVLPGNIVSNSRIQSLAQSEAPEELDTLVDSWQWPGRSGTNEETGSVCLFLASDMASYVTGIELIISGGSELGYGIKAPWKLGLDVLESQFPKPVDPI